MTVRTFGDDTRVHSHIIRDMIDPPLKVEEPYGCNNLNDVVDAQIFDWAGHSRPR